LLKSQVGTGRLIQIDAEAITVDSDQCPWDAPALRRNKRKTNVPTVIRKSTGRVNVPNRPETPQRPPRPEAEAKLSRESISLPTGRPAPWKKTLLDWQRWKAIRRNKTDNAPFY
jgi:hypothetical protein